MSKTPKQHKLPEIPVIETFFDDGKIPETVNYGSPETLILKHLRKFGDLTYQIVIRGYSVKDSGIDPDVANGASFVGNIHVRIVAQQIIKTESVAVVKMDGVYLETESKLLQTIVDHFSSKTQGKITYSDFKNEIFNQVCHQRLADQVERKKQQQSKAEKQRKENAAIAADLDLSMFE